jgi:thioesterase domain-containing protein
MAEHYLGVATDVVGRGPWHLLGWSFGGLVAFEMARRLAQRRRPAASLTLIDTPSRPRFRGGTEEESVLTAVAGTLGVDPARLTAPLSIAAITAAAARPGNLPLAPEQVQRIVRLVDNVHRLRLRYRPGRLAGTLALIRAASTAARDEDFDWASAVDGDVEVFAVPATHESIVLPPAVDEVATLLARVIAAERPAEQRT